MEVSRGRNRNGSLRPLLGLGLALGCLAVVALGPTITAAARGLDETPRSRVSATAVTRKAKPKPKPVPASTTLGSTVVLGFNDLGMHCMNQDFSEICILPPYNTLHAQVIDRSGEEPKILTGGVQVRYSIPGNTISSNKTNFWAFAQPLFGLAKPLTPNVGLTGNRLSGLMNANRADGDFSVTGIPITPVTDRGTYDPFQLGLVEVLRSGKVIAKNQPVVPVSWEISCNLCHSPNNPAGVASDILARHDARFFYGSTPPRYSRPLAMSKPVLCASCHADPALGTPGVKGVPTMSASMHGAHANRFTPAVLTAVKGNTCYACHPGIDTQCQRDVHLAKGITCTNCHGSMADVGNPARKPWVDEPRCTNCHGRKGFAFEEPGKLYKESHGHNGVKCATCHGSPHAITPTVTAADNVQAINVQGHPGTISDCKVCHKTMPREKFNHTRDD